MGGRFVPRADPFSERVLVRTAPNLLSGALLPRRQSYVFPRLLNLRFSVMLARALHSYEALSTPAAAPLQDLVQERRGGGADAEGLDPSEERQGDQLVAGGRDARPQPAALTAQHQNDPRAGVVRRVVGDRRGPRGGGGPARP